MLKIGVGLAQLCILFLNDGAHLQESALIVRNDALPLANLLNDFELLRSLGLALILELFDHDKLVLDDLLKGL